MSDSSVDQAWFTEQKELAMVDVQARHELAQLQWKTESEQLKKQLTTATVSQKALTQAQDQAALASLLLFDSLYTFILEPVETQLGLSRSSLYSLLTKDHVPLTQWRSKLEEQRAVLFPSLPATKAMLTSISGVDPVQYPSWCGNQLLSCSFYLYLPTLLRTSLDFAIHLECNPDLSKGEFKKVLEILQADLALLPSRAGSTNTALDRSSAMSRAAAVASSVASVFKNAAVSFDRDELRVAMHTLVGHLQKLYVGTEPISAEFMWKLLAPFVKEIVALKDASAPVSLDLRLLYVKVSHGLHRLAISTQPPLSVHLSHLIFSLDEAILGFFETTQHLPVGEPPETTPFLSVVAKIKQLVESDLPPEASPTNSIQILAESVKKIKSLPSLEAQLRTKLESISGAIPTLARIILKFPTDVEKILPLLHSLIFAMEKFSRQFEDVVLGKDLNLGLYEQLFSLSHQKLLHLKLCLLSYTFAKEDTPDADLVFTCLALRSWVVNLVHVATFYALSLLPIPSRSSSGAIQRRKSQGVVSAPPSVCPGCDKKLSGKVYRAIGRRWHEACFACGNCKSQIILPSKFFAKDGVPYCQNCESSIQEKCYHCSLVVQGKALKTSVGLFHAACLRSYNAGRKK
eukprot:TRINITY_DN7209_c0_g1_i1.p1 TRINITY_DN7209_c0_g1~~TRINITY_DN7209_c0_g1_i1.p1  ORF type:complete len:646 (-),score=72.76 TRINITY_DN7209_c0_g1_i1:93-1982(-)